MVRLLRIWSCATLAVACCGSSLSATRPGSSTTEAAIDRAIDRFSDGKRGKAADGAWQEVLASLSGRLPDPSARWQSVRAIADQLGAAPKAVANEGRGRQVKGNADPDRSIARATAVTYRFGYRDLVAVDPKHAKDLAAAIKRGDRISLAAIPLDLRLRYLSNGCLPETELALCAIERQLDIHTSFDGYTRFLEDWRNTGPAGEESFYEALDRTSGTADAVFFFDAMLSDFVGKFAGKEGKRWSLQEQHDKLHAAFLAVRQYRGFVEAVAHAIALPANQPFPARLRRYDYESVAAGAYSLRHQIDILIGRHGGDCAAVVAECLAFLREQPPSAALWDDYPLAARFTEHFQTELPAILAGGSSTDELAARVSGESTRLAAALRVASLSFLDVE